MSKQKPSDSLWSQYGFLWFTASLFIVSLIGHWVLAWYAFTAEQLQHQQQPELTEFLIQTGRDTLENWQSEFLQLVWQVSGLALLYHVGSPQSKDGDDRLDRVYHRD